MVEEKLSTRKAKADGALFCAGVIADSRAAVRMNGCPAELFVKAGTTTATARHELVA